MSLAPRNKGFQSFMNAPVEIWQEIIDYILCDPILFTTNPYYPGCNLHTAVNKWSDTNRLLKLEVQRGTLRLVSQSWRHLVDISKWQYFEPYCCVDLDQQLNRSLSAWRLEFYHMCRNKPHFAEGSIYQCGHCEECTEDANAPTGILNLGRDQLKATVARFPLWNQSRKYLDIQRDLLSIVLPNLRALFINVNTPIDAHLINVFVNLTFLSVRVEEPNQVTISKIPTHVFSTLKTLHLEMDRRGNIDFVKQWEMPILSHVQLWLKCSHPNQDSILKFIGQFGRPLVSLRLRVDARYLHLPEDLWEHSPSLEYLGVSPLDTADGIPQGPPQTHPLHTFALVNDEEEIDAWRDASDIAFKWVSLKTIAAWHSWKDVPEDFDQHWNEIIPTGQWDLNELSWKYILFLQIRCNQRGLRYEDCSGRTFVEFQSEMVRPNVKDNSCR